jgi:hypothetical protein
LHSFFSFQFIIEIGVAERGESKHVVDIRGREDQRQPGFCGPSTIFFFVFVAVGVNHKTLISSEPCKTLVKPTASIA